MALTFYGLLEAALLILNGIAILHRERFLKKYGFGVPSHSFDSDSGSVKNQLINLVLAVQTVMRSEFTDSVTYITVASDMA
ncbi:Yos1-like protein [Oesophagostomum dentatum]|uniref:Immediate early response 3-interacting protein 1 n=1 Tax=Oesophagostomum dentatum TaxID=61180 RepID=A0A0B1RWT4_OESDE|nr:Yos1-like protein [Oesophagostomum dentatum]